MIISRLSSIGDLSRKEKSETQNGASYFNHEVLITTASNASKGNKVFARTLSFLLPSSARINRGSHSIASLHDLCAQNHIKYLIIVSGKSRDATASNLKVYDFVRKVKACYFISNLNTYDESNISTIRKSEYHNIIIHRSNEHSSNSHSLNFVRVLFPKTCKLHKSVLCIVEKKPEVLHFFELLRNVDDVSETSTIDSLKFVLSFELSLLYISQDFAKSNPTNYIWRKAHFI